MFTRSGRRFSFVQKKKLKSVNQDNKKRNTSSKSDDEKCLNSPANSNEDNIITPKTFYSGVPSFQLRSRKVFTSTANKVIKGKKLLNKENTQIKNKLNTMVKSSIRTRSSSKKLFNISKDDLKKLPNTNMDEFDFDSFLDVKTNSVKKTKSIKSIDTSFETPTTHNSSKKFFKSNETRTKPNLTLGFTTKTGYKMQFGKSDELETPKTHKRVKSVKNNTSKRSKIAYKRKINESKANLMETSKISVDSGYEQDLINEFSQELLTPSPTPRKRICTTLTSTMGTVTTIKRAEENENNDIISSTNKSIKINDILTPINTNKSDNKLNDSNNKKSVRFYPIFEKNYRPQNDSLNEQNKTQQNKRLSKVSRRRLPFLYSDDQYALDFGQKDFDANRCKVCNMLYTIGEITDEKQHANYHDRFINGLKFTGWKQERTLRYFDDLSRIISIRPTDPKFMLKKVDDLFVIADLELGINCDLQSSMKDSSLYLLYISPDQRVAGFVAAEAIDHASPLLVNQENLNLVSEDEVKATIGVSRIWVHPIYRRRGIGTALLDVLRANFFKERIETKSMLAFTDPTLNGKQFAQAYTDRDDILVFQYYINTSNRSLIHATTDEMFN